MIPFGFDANYLLWVLVPSLILSLGAQFFVRNAYAKWSRQRNSAGVDGEQTARTILQHTSLEAVGLDAVPGEMTDHYDPRTHTVHISQGNVRTPSVAAMAITAHELGHAQQHQERSLLITARNFLVPAVQFSPTIGYLMIFLGLAIGSLQLAWLGILLFGVMVVFMILTLPVEIDASLRGMRLLRQSGLLQSQQDVSGAQQVLTAAALTYFAAQSRPSCSFCTSSAWSTGAIERCAESAESKNEPRLSLAGGSNETPSKMPGVSVVAVNLLDAGEPHAVE